MGAVYVMFPLPAIEQYRKRLSGTPVREHISSEINHCRDKGSWPES
jgi:hypothetical protein